MNEAIKRGFGFGITSGIITTLGLMVGLYSATNSKIVVIGGIITIAVADSLSDAFGIHLSEEFSNKDHSQVWQGTFSTLIFKFLFAIIFLVPILVFEFSASIIISIGFGLILLCVFSVYLARRNETSSFKTTIEHLLMAIFVIIITFLVGKAISYLF